ncbi:MAG: hypothetical protein ACKVII_21210 [Planctomycetales bacterium]
MDAPSPTTENETDEELPLITWGEVPFALLATPFLLVLGVHVAGMAMLLRKWTAIRYVVWMIVLYSGLLTPLVISCPENTFYLALGAAVLIQGVMVALLLAFDDWRDGKSFEMVAIPHILTVLAYLLIPTVSAARNHVS